MTEHPRMTQSMRFVRYVQKLGRMPKLSETVIAANCSRHVAKALHESYIAVFGAPFSTSNKETFNGQENTY